MIQIEIGVHHPVGLLLEQGLPGRRVGQDASSAVHGRRRGGRLTRVGLDTAAAADLIVVVVAVVARQCCRVVVVGVELPLLVNLHWRHGSSPSQGGGVSGSARMLIVSPMVYGGAPAPHARIAGLVQGG